MGHNIEFHEANRRIYLQKTSQNEPKYPVKVRLAVENYLSVNLHAKNSISEEEEIPTIHINVNDERSSNYQQRIADRIFEEMNAGKHLRLSLQERWNWIERKADLTFLCTAYLLLFHECGYEFVFSELGRVLRKQLLEPETKSMDMYFIKYDAVNPLNELEVYIVLHPERLRGFFIPLPESSSKGKASSLWLPDFFRPYPQTDLDINSVQIAGHKLLPLHERLSSIESHSQMAKLFYGPDKQIKLTYHAS